MCDKLVLFNLKQKKERSDLLTLFNLAVPVFHSYGHKVDCQVMLLLYSTTYVIKELLTVFNESS